MASLPVFYLTTSDRYSRKHVFTIVTVEFVGNLDISYENLSTNDHAHTNDLQIIVK